MKLITVFNNSPGIVLTKIIKSGGTEVKTMQLANYNLTDEVPEVELEVGDMIVIENEGDESD